MGDPREPHPPVVECTEKTHSYSKATTVFGAKSSTPNKRPTFHDDLVCSGSRLDILEERFRFLKSLRGMERNSEFCPSGCPYQVIDPALLEWRCLCGPPNIPVDGHIPKLGKMRRERNSKTIELPDYSQELPNFGQFFDSVDGTPDPEDLDQTTQDADASDDVPLPEPEANKAAPKDNPIKKVWFKKPPSATVDSGVSGLNPELSSRKSSTAATIDQGVQGTQRVDASELANTKPEQVQVTPQKGGLKVKEIASWRKENTKLQSTEVDYGYKSSSLSQGGSQAVEVAQQ